MLERELKIVDVDPAMIATILSDCGASHVFSGYVYDLYFDTVDCSLGSSHYSVRLRFQDAACIIAFKQKKKDAHSKLMVENEFVVHDIFFVLSVLFCFGLIPYRCKCKQRTSYVHDGVSFDIDMYDGIPPVLEIEAHTTRLIHDWIARLHLIYHVQLTVGSRGLMHYYNAVSCV